MPYEVIGEEVTVPKALAELKNPETGAVYGYEHRAETYVQGQIIADEDVSPVVVDLYDSGDEHLTSQIKRVSKAAAAKAEEAGEEEEEPAEEEKPKARAKKKGGAAS